MTDVMNGQVPGQAPGGAELSAADEQLVASWLSGPARGLRLTGEGGLLQQLTKRVLESALEGEIAEHLGYGKHDPAGRNSGNSRNGSRAKTVLTEVGPVEVRCPATGRAASSRRSSEAAAAADRRRRDGAVPVGEGLTPGEISAHLAEVYGAEVSKQTISTITDRVMDGMAEWQNRPLDRGLPGDVHGRDQREDPRREGREPARLRGHGRHRRRRARHPRAVGRRTARRGRQVLAAGVTEIKNRGLRTCAWWCATGSRACPTRSRRSGTRPSCRPASSTCCATRSATRPGGTGPRSPDLKPVYTAATEAAGLDRFAEFAGKWEKRTRRSSGCGRTPGPSSCLPRLRRRDPHDHLLDERDRVGQRPATRAVGARGHFPNERPRSSASTWRSSASTPPGGPQALGHPMEARAQRLRHRLRRPTHRRP